MPSVCGGCIHVFLFLVEDNHVLEIWVGGVEVPSADGAVEGEAKRLVVRIFVVVANSAVAEGLVVVRLEVMFTLLDVRGQDDVEGEGLASLLALREQQTLGVATVAFGLQRAEFWVSNVWRVVFLSGWLRIGWCSHGKSQGTKCWGRYLDPEEIKWQEEWKIVILVCYFTTLPVTRPYGIEW